MLSHLTSQIWEGRMGPCFQWSEQQRDETVWPHSFLDNAAVLCLENTKYWCLNRLKANPNAAFILVWVKLYTIILPDAKLLFNFLLSGEIWLIFWWIQKLQPLLRWEPSIGSLTGHEGLFCSSCTSTLGHKMGYEHPEKMSVRLKHSTVKCYFTIVL